MDLSTVWCVRVAGGRRRDSVSASSWIVGAGFIPAPKEEFNGPDLVFPKRKVVWRGSSFWWWGW